VSRHNPPEVSDIITDNFISGRLTREELEDLKSTACEEDDGSYQWWENGVEYRSWNGVKSDYRSAETEWRWKPFVG
jgi:hypothetical protein